MATLNEVFKANEYKRELFPAGEYAVQITDSELSDRKDGKGQDWRFKFKVLRGPLQNKEATFWLAYNIPGAAGGLAQAVDIGRGMIANICRAVGILEPSATEQLNGCKLVITVKHSEGKTGGTFANLSKAEPLKETPAAPVAKTTAAVSGEIKKPAGFGEVGGEKTDGATF